MSAAHSPFAIEIDALIAVSRRLTDLMTAELVALRSMRPRDLAPIIAEKNALAIEYETRFRAVKDRKQDFARLDPLLAEEVRSVTKTLNEVVLSNRRALTAARDVNEKLVRTIADEVSRQRNPASAYTRGGRVEPVGRQSRNPGPLQIDQQA